MEEDDNFFDSFLATFLVVSLGVLDLIEQEESMLLSEHIKEQNRLNRSLPIDKTRPTWTAFCSQISDRHFQRQFRMTHNAFTNLCTLLCAAVGDDTFRPERTIISSRNSESLLRRGGLIPGEIKVALSIRILAGASYLDLVPLFQVSASRIYGIFDEFLEWVLKAFEFPLLHYLHNEDWNALSDIAVPFSYGSNGVFGGIIGALDGLAVRIRSPYLCEVSDPGNYFCRKGFFALNVQAICDRFKKFLWCYTSNKGSTHDSVAFTNSQLYSLLTVKAGALRDNGFYLVGDSAYNLTDFLLVPYTTDDVRADSSDTCDSFNFYLSSSRIHIECAFGELVRRWGILWKTLNFDLAKCQRIIQVCMHLHNHIKDNTDTDDNRDCDWHPPESVNTNGERAFPLVTDNNEQPTGGRRSVLQEQSRQRGEQIRQSISILLSIHGMQRPIHSGMKYNSYGHVYFDG